MKCTIQVNRKEGRSNYGSEGASVEFTLDVPDGEITSNPAGLVDTIRRAQALADQCVEESLARTRTEPHHVEEVSSTTPARDRLPSQARPPSAPEPTRQYDPRIGPDGAARFKTDGFPRSGRELVPWSRKREESGAYPGLFKRLVAYGKSQGFREMVNTWNADEVKEAVYGVLGDGFDEPEPEPVGHNGYHSNGHSNGYGGR